MKQSITFNFSETQINNDLQKTIEQNNILQKALMRVRFGEESKDKKILKFLKSLKITIILLFILGVLPLNATIQIGTGTNTNKEIPIYAFYGYTYSQQIYLASEIGTSGTITHLEFYFNGSSLSKSNNWTIYVGHTTKSSFSSKTDWVAVSSLTQVYSATFTNPGSAGWISFDITDFAYNGTDNLIIAVDENKSGYNSSSNAFYCSSVSSYRSLTYYSDGTNPNPSSPPTARYRYKYIPNIKLTVGTAPYCPQPTNQSVSDISTTSTKLNWTENGSASSWQIEWGSKGFSQGTGTTITTSTKPYTLTGLSSDTKYDWYIRASCGGSNNSSWEGPNTFMTAISTFPWNEDFENAGNRPSGWSEEYVSGSHNWKFQKGGYSNSNPSTAHGGNYNACFEKKTKNTKTKLISPVLDISSLSNPQLSFWHTQKNNGSYQDVLKVYYKTSSSGTWTQITGADYTTSISWWTKVTLNLPSASSNYYIAFEALDDKAYGVCIDDVKIEGGSCARPNNQSVSNKTSTSIKLNWTENGSATSWQIEWGAKGFSQGSGTTVTTSSKPYLLSGLSSGTKYDWYVRSSCGGSNYSTWEGPYSFLTTINSYPWNENFDHNDYIPVGWSMEHISGTNRWAFQKGGYYNSDPSSAHSGNYNACLDYASSGSKTKLITPRLNISNISNPELSFWHTQKAYDGDQDELRVYYKTSASGSWTLISGATFTSSISSWTKRTFSLPSASADYYIAFEGLDNFGHGVCIDDVKVDGTSCPTPSSLTESSITQTSAQLNWTQSGSSTSWQIEWGTEGFTQGSGTTVSVSSKPYSLSGLSQATSYDWYVRTNCGGGTYSSWAKSTFATSCGTKSLPWSQGFESMNSYGNGVLPICWDANGATMFTTSNTTEHADHLEPKSGSAYIYVDMEADDWLFTPSFSLTGGSSYEFSFYYITNGNNWDALKVYIGKAQDSDSMNTQIGSSLTNFSNTSYQKKTINFTPSTSGTYYIGLYFDSDINTDNLSLDNFELKEGCNVKIPTYTENFGNYLDPCWQEATGALKNHSSLTYTNSQWRDDGFANNGTTGSAGIKIYGTSLKDWLLSTSIDLSGGNYQLEYDMSLTEHSSSTSGAGDSTLSSDDSVVVVISTDNGSTWSKSNILKTWKHGDKIPNEAYHHIINLSSYSSTVKIGFYATSSQSNGNTDFFIDNFKIISIPSCQQLHNQYADNIAKTSATLHWDDFGNSTSWTIEYKRGSDFTPGASQCDASISVSGSSSYNLSGLIAGNTYYWYVKSSCSSWLGADNFKTTPNKVTTSGQITVCSPHTEESSYIKFYDSYSFTLSQSGKFDIEGIFYGMIGQIRVYQSSFNPTSTGTHQIADQGAYSQSGSSNTKANINNLSLNSGTTYIIVLTSNNYDNSKPNYNNFDISILGPGTITANGTTDYNGIPSGAAFDVPNTDGNTRIADYSCDDSNGWTHYYDDNGTHGQANVGHRDDKLLLSIKKNGNNIGSISSGLKATIKGSAGAAHITNPPANYVSSWGGWYVFNRYWKIVPETQPTSSVTVRFYYTTDDYNKLKTAISNDGGTPPTDHQNMSCFKINSLGSTSYDPNPTNGHSGIPLASAYNTDGCWIYTYATSSSADHWAYGTYDSWHYFEYPVAHFSGGGGGAAKESGNGDGSPLPVEIISLTAYNKQNINIIEWSTASQFNCQTFIIERFTSADSSHIEEICRQNAQGNSNILISYSANDNNPAPKSFYRIKSIDFDGKIQYSNWVSVIQITNQFVLNTVFPNPVKTILSIESIHPNKEKGCIELRDFLGRLIIHQDVNFVNGTNINTINLEGIENGSYIISVISGNNKQSEIIIKP